VRVTDAGLHGIAHPISPELAGRARVFLQNVGGFLSSRAAEDELVRLGLRPAAEPEETFRGDAETEVRRALRPAFPGIPDDQFFLANCGMNAVDSAFRAVTELQSAQGRTVWIQLGWLYLDTIAILQKFTRTPGDYVHVRDVFDLSALEKILNAHAGRVAGIVAEVPTNPLIQTPKIAAIAALARRCAALHVEHIATGGDPFELGSRRPLDFGHWAAHKLEQLSDFQIRHGEAVAIGIALDVIYSRETGLLDARSAERILKLLEQLGFDLFANELLNLGSDGQLQVLGGLNEFREHLGGELTITLLRAIGQGVEVHEMNLPKVVAAIQELQERLKDGCSVEPVAR